MMRELTCARLLLLPQQLREQMHRSQRLDAQEQDGNATLYNLYNIFANIYLA
jgi:hypothetical protein